MALEEMCCLEQESYSWPSHLSMTRRKTGRELGEHLGEHRHKTPVQESSPAIGEGGN